MPDDGQERRTAWEAPERGSRWRVVVVVVLAGVVAAAGAAALVRGSGPDSRDQLAVDTADGQAGRASRDQRVDVDGPGAGQGEGWRRLASAPLGPRFAPLSVWTGEEWLVVGGQEGSTVLASGARYDPDADEWRRITDAPEPLSAELQQAAWTGSELIVWGRSAADGPVGLAYEPAEDRWRRLPGAPLEPRVGHGLAWVGGEVVVWGGSTQDGPVRGGAAYEPGADAWRDLPEAPLPPGEPLVVPTGGAGLMVWSQAGASYEDAPMRGAHYDARADRWRRLAPGSAPVGGPKAATGVWTGQQMIVCCHTDPDEALRIYDPGPDVWRRRPAPATVADRMLHTAVWIGDAMLVWGGRQDLAVWLRGNGAVYEPDTRSWTAVAEAAPRMPRIYHTSAWTGEELLVWGGFDGRRSRADGAAYRP